MHRLLQQADPEAAARRRQVAVGVVPLARREARADGDVADVRADELEQPRELVRGMLAVGVDPAAERVAALVRLAVARGDPGAQAAVLAERDDDRAGLARDRGGGVGRAVVDHEHVGVGQHRRELGEHGGQVLLLVPGRDEDDRVGAESSSAGGYSEQNRCRVSVAPTASVTKGDNAVPGIDAKSDAIYDLVEEGSGVEQLATGFTFTEGPIWHPDEQVLYFSDMPADIRRKVTLDGTVTEVRNPSFKCNGMVLDADLNLLVCEHVTSSLVRERTDGVRETLAFHWQGKYLNSPNDVTVRSDGTIYFSDPWYGRFPGFGIERARELGWQGVFRIPPGGGQDELDLAVARTSSRCRTGSASRPTSRCSTSTTPRAPTSRSTTSTPTARSRTAACSSRASAPA